jgi:hypothetical protein
MSRVGRDEASCVVRLSPYRDRQVHAQQAHTKISVICVICGSVKKSAHLRLINHLRTIGGLRLCALCNLRRNS